MITVTSSSKKQNIVTQQQGQTSIQKNQKQIQGYRQLTRDTVEFQQQTNEQVAKKAQEILDQAQLATTSEGKLLGMNKAIKTMQAQVAKQKDQALKEKQEQTLAKMMQENAEIRRALDEPTPADSTNYPRPVTQVEEKLVDHMIQDLAHPDTDLAKKAKERLKQLGLSDNLLNKLTEKLKAGSRSKTSLKFGGGEVKNYNYDPLDNRELDDLIRGAKQDIYFGNTADKVVNVGVDHQLETVQHSVNPVLFGGGGYYPKGYDHNGYPYYEWSQNLT